MKFPLSFLQIIVLSFVLSAGVMLSAYATNTVLKISVYGAMGNGAINVIPQSNGTYWVYQKQANGRMQIWKGVTKRQMQGWMSAYDLGRTP